MNELISSVLKDELTVLFPTFDLYVRRTQVTDKKCETAPLNFIAFLKLSSSGWLSSIPILSMLKHCPCYFPRLPVRVKRGMSLRPPYL